MTGFDDWNSSLMHYGVVGMRWGVRKDPRKAYEKAVRKAAALGEKVAKKQMKVAKAEAEEYKYGKRASYYTYRKNKALGKVSKKDDAFIKKQAKIDDELDGVHDKRIDKENSRNLKAKKYEQKTQRAIEKMDAATAKRVKADKAEAKAALKLAKWNSSVQKAFKNVDMETFEKKKKKGKKVIDQYLNAA